jgi:serine/threonine protein kinase
MSADYIRLCPTCGAENAPDVMRCACGAMLFGVDLIRKDLANAPLPATDATPASAAPIEPPAICPHDDCGQSNPPGSSTCVYCNRALASGATLTPVTQSLLNLPAALKERYRIVKPFPATGAEAEILLVEAIGGGQPLVAKIYRQGIHPKAAVKERISRIPERHRVAWLETGVSEGHAYELMEFCAHGSLRDRLAGGALTTEACVAIVRELAAAVAAVHGVGLLHRDLKPENVLVRSEQPLELLLTDFGIASVIDATQRFTSAARTLPYASPESLSGVIDGKSDYWALGMIILEAVQGKHPFAGLSEAVILHHLTTRSINLDGIRDPACQALRKLLRGLLLRDPKQRWGADEITRWLAGDAGLTEPIEIAPGSGFAQPYHLGSDICHTPEQLAIALSRNWQAGLADIGNSQLLNWFRDVQKDQNTVRLLLALQYERQLHIDVQLLKLMLHLAPGLPPVWRGENIELPAILTRANLALKGDADAARWLDALYQHRVLNAYADAGNAEVADVAKRWTDAADRFLQTWQASAALIKARRAPRDPDEVVLYDDAVFGKGEFECPSLMALHPRLLATAYDARWSERLRQRLQAELAELAVHCPWLSELGDPQRLDASGLLVMEALLPEARKAAQRQRQAAARRTAEAEAELHEFQNELATTMARLRQNAQGGSFWRARCDEVRSNAEDYLNLLARLRATGRSDAPWQTLRQTAGRNEPNVNRLLKLLDDLEVRRTANAGWISLRVQVATGLVVWLVPSVVGEASLYPILAVIAGILAWRFVPVFIMMKQLRELARKFSNA